MADVRSGRWPAKGDTVIWQLVLSLTALYSVILLALNAWQEKGRPAVIQSALLTIISFEVARMWGWIQ